MAEPEQPTVDYRCWRCDGVTRVPVGETPPRICRNCLAAIGDSSWVALYTASLIGGVLLKALREGADRG